MQFPNFKRLKLINQNDGQVLIQTIELIHKTIYSTFNFDPQFMSLQFLYLSLDILNNILIISYII